MELLKLPKEYFASKKWPSIEAHDEDGNTIDDLFYKMCPFARGLHAPRGDGEQKPVLEPEMPCFPTFEKRDNIINHTLSPLSWEFEEQEKDEDYGFPIVFCSERNGEIVYQGTTIQDYLLKKSAAVSGEQYFHRYLLFMSEEETKEKFDQIRDLFQKWAEGSRNIFFKPGNVLKIYHLILFQLKVFEEFGIYNPKETRSPDLSEMKSIDFAGVRVRSPIVGLFLIMKTYFYGACVFAAGKSFAELASDTENEKGIESVRQSFGATYVKFTVFKKALPSKMVGKKDNISKILAILSAAFEKSGHVAASKIVAKIEASIRTVSKPLPLIAVTFLLLAVAAISDAVEMNGKTKNKKMALVALWYWKKSDEPPFAEPIVLKGEGAKKSFFFPEMLFPKKGNFFGHKYKKVEGTAEKNNRYMAFSMITGSTVGEKPATVENFDLAKKRLGIALREQSSVDSSKKLALAITKSMANRMAMADAFTRINELGLTPGSVARIVADGMEAGVFLEVYKKILGRNFVTLEKLFKHLEPSLEIAINFFGATNDITQLFSIGRCYESLVRSYSTFNIENAQSLFFRLFEVATKNPFIFDDAVSFLAMQTTAFKLATGSDTVASKCAILSDYTLMNGGAVLAAALSFITGKKLTFYNKAADVPTECQFVFIDSVFSEREANKLDDNKKVFFTFLGDKNDDNATRGKSYSISLPFSRSMTKIVPVVTSKGNEIVPVKTADGNPVVRYALDTIVNTRDSASENSLFAESWMKMRAIEQVYSLYNQEEVPVFVDDELLEKFLEIGFATAKNGVTNIIMYDRYFVVVNQYYKRRFAVAFGKAGKTLGITKEEEETSLFAIFHNPGEPLSEKKDNSVNFVIDFQEIITEQLAKVENYASGLELKQLIYLQKH